MSTAFNVDEYRAACRALIADLDEMKNAVHDIMYECGEGGISSRATAYLGMLNASYDDANKSRAEMVKLMVKQLSEQDK